MTHAQLKANALRWANRQRAKQGKRSLKRLPKGMRHAGADACPLANATGFLVMSGSYRPTGYRLYKLPDRVCKFVGAFDAGFYPELEA